MQVSIACTEHNLKGRNGEHGKQSTSSPNMVNAARAKFRTVAIIARSFGSFTPRHHISLKESTGKLTGMKYRLRQQCHLWLNNIPPHPELEPGAEPQNRSLHKGEKISCKQAVLFATSSSQTQLLYNRSISAVQVTSAELSLKLLEA
ncbi:voltage-gated potassium channel subunit beta-1 isoform X1 [Arapaima gigas]